MTEWILSVGIDVGTSTTQVVFSRLQVENIASSFSVPRIMIVDKRIVFRSEIHTTPLISPDEIDAEALKQIVIDEYEKAGFQPADVGTGAAIITGETARAENAEQVLSALSELAGDFVVATAGPHLESVLAARGAGIDEYSAHARGVIANLDIGGGTTNIAAYEHGQLLGTSCLDIGGRLVRISPDRRITYVSPQIVKLAASAGIPLAVGDQANAERLRTLTRVMARHLAMSIGLVER
ncbi:MAG: ethanolamine ammonia-lyase, partial [Propionibacterium sp.]|nr:ethanolamine ammonia-lyase [Propionibacterium sp.]